MSNEDGQFEQDQSLMERISKRLGLGEKSMRIVQEFKQTEADIFYTLQYQKQQFPVLPQTEDYLFLTPLENQLEKIFMEEARLSVSSEATDSGISSFDAQDDQPARNRSSSESAHSEAPEIATSMNMFMQNRDPERCQTQTQPIAMYELWAQSMRSSFGDGRVTFQ